MSQVRPPSRRRLMLVLATVLVVTAGGVAAWAGNRSSAPGPLVVQPVLGGGTSGADSGRATDLRLPRAINAVAVAPDRTIWVAAADSRYEDASELVKVTPDGQAERFRLTGH